MGLFSYMNLVFAVTLFHGVAILAVSSTASMKPLCHNHERYALLQFKQSLSINKKASSDPSAYPKVESWKLDQEANSSDCCYWDGVRCDVESGHVTMLDLSSSCLYGVINSSSTLFHLVHLQRLNLADNNFSFSNIPSQIINLSNLSYLNLSRSFFSGQIPSDMLELSNLVSLDLTMNQLMLHNPGLQNLADKLTNLELLFLYGVDISSPVPDILANMSSLRNLTLIACNLQGEFPSRIFHLPNLYSLRVPGNRNLKGYLPEFDKSSPLAYLDIRSCSFSGTIPSSLGNLTNLRHLYISDNEFSGEWPAFIANLGSLIELDLSLCYFSGQIPSSFSNLTQLTFLDLSSNSFSPPSSSSLSWIANLSKLTLLGLFRVNLVGEVPSWLMNLTQLTALGMGSNQLTGPIPYWLMNLNQLRELHLNANQLTGPIPFEIRNLTQLSLLHLASNQLQGSIPSSFFELENLEILDLHSNNLSGRVDLDKFLLKFKRLKVLMLSSNNLSLLIENSVDTIVQIFDVIGLGSCNLNKFPNFLRKQDRLILLDLSSNKIAGQIPEWFFNVSVGFLGTLNLSHNLLTGFDQYPVVLPWISLTTLDLRSNKLQGPLPVPSLSTFSYLVSNNEMAGEIPPWICKLNVQFLDLSFNNLSGMLPQCSGNFSYSIEILKLNGNKFYGSIPETFVNGSRLKMIDLSYNKLQGKMPRSLINSKWLEFLNLGNNRINDTFPSWLGTLPELQVLILQSNRFHGVVKEPEKDIEFPKLRIIDLSHNRFKGNLPSKYFECWSAMKVVNASQLSYMHDGPSPPVRSVFPNDFYYECDYSLTMRIKGMELEYQKISNMLTGMILSNNRFTGEIPTSISNLKGLRFLDLSNNNLLDRIPSSLGDMTVLESLDISNNRLSGEIPRELVELTFLAFFNASHNSLTGPIPQGRQFDTFDNRSFYGNAGLCGLPLSRKCENSDPSQKEDQSSESPFAFGWKIVLIGYASGLIVGAVLGQQFYIWKHEWFVKIFGETFQRIKRHRVRRN